MVVPGIKCQPIPPCPKRMLNGPCGGVREGYTCEVDGRRCVWIDAFIEAKRRGNLKPFTEVLLDANFKVRDYKPKTREPKSKVMKLLLERKYILAFEVETGRNIDLTRFKELSRELSPYYDTLTFTDNPVGSIEIDPLVPAIISQNNGVESILHVTCKNRDRVALTSYLMAAAAAGIRNIIAVTGDWPFLSGAKYMFPSFDLDAVRLIYLARLMTDLHVDFSGRRIGGNPFFHVFTAFNPHFAPLELEALKLIKKIKAGAEAVFSQPIYSVSTWRKVKKYFKEYGIEVPVVVGLMPVKSIKMAKVLMRELGIYIPEEYVRFLNGSKSYEEIYSFNIEYFRKLAENLMAEHDGISGFHVLTFGDLKLASELGRYLRKLR